MSVILKCIYGPELYRIYRLISSGSVNYSGNALERYSSTIITSIQTALSVSIYASPLIMTWLYRRDFFTSEGLAYLTKVGFGITLVYICAFYVRGIGRVFNPVYRQFIDVHSRCMQNLSPENKALISNYDFHFGWWPTEADYSQTGPTKFLAVSETKSVWQQIKDIVGVHSFAWLMLHSFGIKLIYPGSIQLLQASISSTLQYGRAQLVIEKGGKRHKVIASDGNTIDLMTFDRRTSEKGQTLVISCDGNAGFYEIGVLGTPLELGYSVIGWNHPGFGGSTGTPYPQNDANAADAVMQFAINELGFRPDQIILHGWSIGGFTASCMAMNYPDVKGVVIDASFDQLLPLAVPRMPQMLEPLVTYAVKNFVSLNVAEQLKHFPGPIRIIRRLLDEMIATELDSLKSNRGNHLLVDILQHRFPHICQKESLKKLWTFLSYEENRQNEMLAELNVNEDLLNLLPEDKTYPSSFGNPDDGSNISDENKMKVILLLAKMYLEQVDSTHCSPLPKEKFHLPPY